MNGRTDRQTADGSTNIANVVVVAADGNCKASCPERRHSSYVTSATYDDGLSSVVCGHHVARRMLLSIA